jgi:hypothetical protein
MTSDTQLGPERCNCLAVRQAARRITQFYDQCLASSGLRTTQFSILVKLKRLGPMTINALAAELVMDRTTLGRNILPLQRERLIDVVKGRADRRSKELRDRGWCRAPARGRQRLGTGSDPIRECVRQQAHGRTASPAARRLSERSRRRRADRSRTRGHLLIGVFSDEPRGRAEAARIDVRYSAGCGARSGARRRPPGRNIPANATNPAQPANASHSIVKLPVRS